MLGTSRNREAETLAKYATVVTDAGYAVETDAARERLVVTAKDARPPMSSASPVAHARRVPWLYRRP